MEIKATRPERVKTLLRECLCWDRAFSRNVLIVALPMVLQQLLEASLHIVDGLMVSALGDMAYSAVTQANRYTFLFNLFCFGACTGSAIYLSQYWGARDIKRMHWSMGLSMGFALLISLLFSAGGMFFAPLIVNCFLQPGESFELAVRYLRIVSLGYLFTGISGVYATAIKSAERTYLPMLAGMAGIVCNTVMNYALIFGKLGFPAMGVEGAALATVLSAFVTMAINIGFAYGKHLPAGAKLREWLCRDRVFIVKYVKTVIPVILNEGFWALGTTMYSVYYGRMGDSAVATMGVCNTINDLVWVAIFAMMNATAIIVGKTLGTGDKVKAYLYSKRMIACAMLSGIVLGVLVTVLRWPLVNLFSGLSYEVREKAQLILVLGAATIWFRSFNTINIVGVLRSGGDTLFSLILDVGSLWVVGVPIVGLAALVFHWPLEYVYLCTLLEEAVKMAIGIPHFKKKQWMNVLTEQKEA
ncbi:MAG: MATE family efflux transporter [Eubacteriales bacterium]|nr:MATE family efflux transporter [Eubacteriales bacterium]